VTGRHDSHSHHRHSIRLPGWDYRTQAYYFVTICAHQRENLFDNQAFAELVANLWQLIPGRDHARGVILDEWVVMPNHLHGLLLLPGSTALEDGDEKVILPGLPFDMRYVYHQAPDVKPGDRPKTLPGSLGSIIGTYKSGVTRRINALRRSPGRRVWQRGYYEHIVRNHHELGRIQTYIRDNPARWAEDRENLDELLERMIYRSD
jgi:REP element-mobilizing transposase RayT